MGRCASACPALLGLCLLLLAGSGCRREARGGQSASRAVSASAAAPRPKPTCVGRTTLRFFARRGEYIHAVAEQGSRDVSVTLFDPGGQLLTVDSLAAAGAPWPAEEVHWIAETTGDHRLEVALGEGQGGPCPLRLAEQRRATAADRARVLAETALARAHELRRPRDEKRSRQAVDRYAEAQRRFQELDLPVRRAEALLGEAQVRERLGELRSAKDDLDGAIGEYRRSLELRRQLGNRTGEALTANNLGLALHLRGRYDEAANTFERALELWQEGDSPIERAKTFLNRGRLHLDLGETKRARERFRVAAGLYRQAHDREGEAAALNALGIASLDEDKPDAALPPLEKALALRQVGSRGWAVTLTTLGLADQRLGRREEARRAYAEALPIFLLLGDRREQARTLLGLGWLEATTGHDDAALGDFGRALDLFAQLGDPPELAWTLRAKAEVLRHSGRLDEARQTMEEALDEVERHRFRQQSGTTRAAFFATQQGSYDFLIDLLMEMHQRSPTVGYDAAALEVSERALARSLLDALAASGTELGGAAPGLLARERGLESTIDDLATRQSRLAEDPSANERQFRLIEEKLARRWEELFRVRAELRAKSPRYAALTQPRPESTKEIQHRLLAPDTLLLEYRLGKERSFLWALTPGSLASFALPGRAELEGKVGRVHRLLAGSYAQTAAISADLELQKLSSVLLGPVADLLPGKRLLVVGDGALQTLPFAALPEPRAARDGRDGRDGEPLVAHHEIVSLPSVSVLGELRREVAGRRPAPRSLWVLAEPDFAGAFPPLPYSGQEAAAILALAPAGKAALVRGREARREVVLGSPLRDYRVLHFATHNSFVAGDPGAPGGGRLVLAQVDGSGRPVADGFLHLADIYQLSLKADLVVLSACQSALGREVKGEGLVGMTRGFFYAGAERVLVSLWNVNDRVTVDLMEHFYRGMLRQGLSPAAALRAAQDAIRRQERWRSPYYWAGFALQGEWRGR
jgi:CHAT domain-containing protein/tetratricopeptide (TPR) repeat protein